MPTPHRTLLSISALAATALSLLAASDAVGQVPRQTSCAPDATDSPWRTTEPRLVAAFPSALIPLRDGRVMLCGGTKTVGGATATCELWDPAEDEWTLFTPDMPHPLTNPIGRELSDGSVFVCDGNESAGGAKCLSIDASGDWELLAGPNRGNLNGGQSFEMAELADGRVVIHSLYGGGCAVSVYDRNANAWTNANCNNSGRVLLTEDGELYVDSARGDQGPRWFNPATNAFEAIEMPTRRRANHLYLPSQDGFWQGGGNLAIWGTSYWTRSSDVYDPATDSWATGTPMPFYANGFNRGFDYAPLGADRWFYHFSGNWVQNITNLSTYGFYQFNAGTGDWGSVCAPPSTPYLRPPDETVMARDPSGSGRVFLLASRWDTWNQIPEARDLTVYIFDPSATDTDGDGVHDCCDNCPNTPNALQVDSNSNGLGDLCEVCGDGTLAQAPTPQNDVLDLVAIQFTRNHRQLARVGDEETITLTVRTRTFVRFLEIEEPIPPGTELVSEPGSNTWSGTDIGANSTITLTYTLRMPEGQGLVSGESVVTVEPLELTRETLGMPLTIIAFKAEECDDGNTDDGDGCSSTCRVEPGWTCPFGWLYDYEAEMSYFAQACVPICGDGTLVGIEGCDDGNTDSNDGCRGPGNTGLECAVTYPEHMSFYPWDNGNVWTYCFGCFVEPGWECPGAGEPCRPLCGDGRRVGTETCDDGNTDDGDGCSASCEVETGWACGNTFYECGEDTWPWGTSQNCWYRSGCMPACGDGIISGDETCDDGNNTSGDGCSGRPNGVNNQQCVTAYQEGRIDEPDFAYCRGCRVEDGFACEGAECGPVCGDGSVVGTEACDDGNLQGGDGCDGDCGREEGWYCPTETRCDNLNEWPWQVCRVETIHCYPICGDNLILGDEECDDGNSQYNDGCTGRETNEVCARALRDLAAGVIGEGQVPGNCFGCQTERCGDGYRQSNETCDDGNELDGDGCTADCGAFEDGWNCDDSFGRTVCAPVCGDGVVLGAEACDDANTNGGDGCDDQCRIEDGWSCDETRTACAPVCGDLYVRGDETCDDGNAEAGDGCDAECQTEEGWSCWTPGQQQFYGCCVESEEGRTCTPSSPGLCSRFCEGTCEWVTSDPEGSTCQTVCGDGIRTPDEACDDGNGSPGDGCSWDCTVEIGFTCDEAEEVFCAAVCGDGLHVFGEGCDDGNLEDGDGCSAACEVESGWSCQDAVEWSYGVWSCCDAEMGAIGCEPLAGEEELCPEEGCARCDYVNYPGGGSTCAANCGDGVLAGAEQCDDGNLTSGDGCSRTCGLEAGWACPLPGAACGPDCGDGLVFGNEQCDDGNEDAGDGCSAFCNVEPGWTCPTAGEACVGICGDGLVRGSEQCDDGNRVAGDGCDAACATEQGFVCPPAGGPCINACGNGVLEEGEACDDGNRTTGDGCSRLCELESGWVCAEPGRVCATVCGDALLAGIEGCDDGNGASGDGCDARCQVEPGWTCDVVGAACATVCGDGLRRGGEGCDDGNAVGGDGCSAECTPEDGWVCPPAGGGCARTCGDGDIDEFEACDDGNRTSGDGCNANCQLEDGFVCGDAGTACVTVCGDGVQVMPEHCDDGNLEPGDGCSETCQVEAGWECPPELEGLCRPRCGDGIVVGTETCDDANDAAGDGCSGVCQVEDGWTCALPGAPCTKDPVCGNGEVEGGETCDDGNTMDGDGCSGSCEVETPDEPVCGNRVVEEGEACDDGNLVNGDGCSVDCELDGPDPDSGVVAQGGGCAGGGTSHGGLALLLALVGIGTLAGRRRAARRC